MNKEIVENGEEVFWEQINLCLAAKNPAEQLKRYYRSILSRHESQLREQIGEKIEEKRKEYGELIEKIDNQLMNKTLPIDTDEDTARRIVQKCCVVDQALSDLKENILSSLEVQDERA